MAKNSLGVQCEASKPATVRANPSNAINFCACDGLGKFLRYFSSEAESQIWPLAALVALTERSKWNNQTIEC